MSLKEKGWELVQIKAFTSWMNSVLAKRDMEVHDIKTDLSDGVNLINFLEILSGKKLKQKYDKKPPSRIQKIQNLSIALTFLENKMNVKPSKLGISAEDFADENLKMILGFLWSLFKIYKIQTIKHEDKSSEEGLLAWVKKATEGYPGVNIESFKYSFRSGLAFLALCDKYVENSEILNYSNYDKSNSEKNLTDAFDIAEQHLGVPKLVDPVEVSEGDVDERSLILYVSLFFHAFVAKEQQSALEEDKARMEAKMLGLQGSLESRAQMAEKLDKENVDLKQQIEELKEQLQEEQRNYSQLKEKDSYLEEKVTVLNQLLEQEKEEKEQLQKKTQDMSQEIENLKKQLASLQEGELAELNAQLTKERAERKKEQEEWNSRSQAELKGLGVLKKNLEEHVEDLHRWQTYLDIDINAEVDFTGELRPQIMADITDSNFDDQLSYLAKKLGDENETLLTLLKIKESEQKQKKESEKKKKERQAKSEE